MPVSNQSLGNCCSGDAGDPDYVQRLFSILTGRAEKPVATEMPSKMGPKDFRVRVIRVREPPAWFSL